MQGVCDFSVGMMGNLRNIVNVHLNSIPHLQKPSYFPLGSRFHHKDLFTKFSCHPISCMTDNRSTNKNYEKNETNEQRKQIVTLTVH